MSTQAQKKVMVAEKTETKIEIDARTKTEIINQIAVDYKLVHEQAKLLQAQADEKKAVLNEEVPKYGVTDYDGNIVMEIEDGDVTLQKRVKASLNKVMLLQLLEEKNLLDKCATPVMDYIIDEEAVQEAVYGGLISKDELEGIFTESEYYALYVNIDENKYPVISEVIEARKAIEKKSK